MELIANEMSIQRQFHDVSTFHGALERLMQMRGVACRYGRSVYCNRALVDAEPIPGIRMQQVAQRLAESSRRALMIWLTREGPFWDDLRRHSADDWLECGDDVVTDTAVGEAAYRTVHGVECALVSARPSAWDYSPVEVLWKRKAEGLDDRDTNLRNWRDAGSLEAALREAPPPIRSWAELGECSRIRFEGLTFSEGCFDSLTGIPFAKSATNRILVLLDILERLANAFDVHGSRTAEGTRILRDYFTGDNALFSDSSASERHRFRAELTFRHPDRPDESLFCTWHGKVRHMTLRLHFSWPIGAGKPVYIVYVGPKLTRR